MESGSGSQCMRCRKRIQHGAVVEFGDGMFHLDCFCCEQCYMPVDCESNPLLLTSGMPMCEKCSPICKACHKKIYQEAIMIGQDGLGNDAYHEDCFRCLLCQHKIENLVFTQTSKGIYCNPCHDKRRSEKMRRSEKSGWSKSLRRSPPSPPPEKPKRPLSEFKLFTPFLNASSLFKDSSELNELPRTLGPQTPPPTAKRQDSGKTSLSSRASRALRSSFSANFQADAADASSQGSLSRRSSNSRSSRNVRASASVTSLPRQFEDANKTRLQSELKQVYQQLANMTMNYNRIKEASKNALEEFSRTKDEFAQEIAQRQRLERTVLHLRRRLLPEMGQSDYDDIQQLLDLQSGLEQACDDLKHCRDDLLEQIKTTAVQSELTHLVDAHRAEVQTLLTERGMLRKEIIQLRAERAAILNQVSSESSGHLSCASPTPTSPNCPSTMDFHESISGLLSSEDTQAAVRLLSRSDSSRRPALKKIPTDQEFTESCPPTPPTSKHTTSSVATDITQGSGRTRGESISSSTRVFDIPLSDLVKREKRAVPCIVEVCVRAVKTRALEYEGIYRKNGGFSKKEKLKEAFEQGWGEQLVWSEEYSGEDDICAITSVLKTFLRQLPEPIMTYKLYDAWLQVMSSNAQRQQKREDVSRLLLKLPTANYHTLKAVLQHLYRVQEHEETNKMNARNLAVTFAPSLLWVEDQARESKHQDKKNKVIQYLIAHAFEVFPPDA